MMFSLRLWLLSRFYLAVRMYRSEKPSPGLALGVGFSAAAALLTKFTNAPVVLIVGILAVVTFRKFQRTKQSAAGLVAAVLLLSALCVPVGCWLARNYFVLGDLAGTAAEHRFLDWKPKPWVLWVYHPVFTPSGFAHYWATLMRSFWQGEICWHAARMANWWVDAIYVASTTLFLLAFVVSDIARGSQNGGLGRLWASGCLAVLTLYVALLIVLSLSFDFGRCVYPFAGLAVFLVGTADSRRRWCPSWSCISEDWKRSSAGCG